jgi:hypothetical protein
MLNHASAPVAEARSESGEDEDISNLIRSLR